MSAPHAQPTAVVRYYLGKFPSSRNRIAPYTLASNKNGLYSLRIELRRFPCLCGFFRKSTDFCRLKYDKLSHILRFSTSQVFDKHKY